MTRIIRRNIGVLYHNFRYLDNNNFPSKPAIFGPFQKGFNQTFCEEFDLYHIAHEDLFGSKIETVQKYVSPTSATIHIPPENTNPPGSNGVHSIKGDISPAFYSIIIVLETLDKDGNMHENSVKFTEEIEQVENLANSQSTCVSLSKDNNLITPKILKQNILIDGYSYLLQDIFGLTNDEDDNNVSSSDCVICMSEVKDAIVMDVIIKGFAMSSFMSVFNLCRSFKNARTKFWWCFKPTNRSTKMPSNILIKFRFADKFSILCYRFVCLLLMLNVTLPKIELHWQKIDKSSINLSM
jgi:hypothetical protein